LMSPSGTVVAPQLTGTSCGVQSDLARAFKV